MGQREHDVEVGHGQQCSRTRGQPLGTRVPLALRAVPAAACNGEISITCLMGSFFLW
jgi:hypothetical protein